MLEEPRWGAQCCLLTLPLPSPPLPHYPCTLQVTGTAVEVAVKVQSVRDEGGRYFMEAGATCPQLTAQLKRRLAAQAAAGAAGGTDCGGASTVATAHEREEGRDAAARSSGRRAAPAGGEGVAAEPAGAGGSADEEGSLNLSLYIRALLDISRKLLAVC